MVERQWDPHHLAWLSAHPDRTPEWLAEKLAEGFDVHHLDGERSNNDPSNVALVEHLDHMRLHGSPGLNRLLQSGRARRGPTSLKKRTRNVLTREIIALRKELDEHRRASAVAKFEASNPFADDPGATLLQTLPSQ